MDRYGIQCQNLKLGYPPALEHLDDRVAIQVARIANDEIADHPVDDIRLMPDDLFLARRAPFVGTPQQIVDQVGEFVQRVTSFVLNFPDLKTRGGGAIRARRASSIPGGT